MRAREGAQERARVRKGARGCASGARVVITWYKQQNILYQTSSYESLYKSIGIRLKDGQTILMPYFTSSRFTTDEKR